MLRDAPVGEGVLKTAKDELTYSMDGSQRNVYSFIPMKAPNLKKTL